MSDQRFRHLLRLFDHQTESLFSSKRAKKLEVKFEFAVFVVFLDLQNCHR